MKVGSDFSWLLAASAMLSNGGWQAQRWRVIMKAAVVGLGDMGSGLALNLIKAGFETWGFDIDQKRMASFSEFG
jgi:phosphoglycerate dehydrogenase-like enzyme